jgi:carboxylesterase type B
MNSSNRNDTRPILSNLGTDYILACSTRKIAQAMANNGAPTYLYEFDHVLSFDAWGPRYQAIILYHENILYILYF